MKTSYYFLNYGKTIFSNLSRIDFRATIFSILFFLVSFTQKAQPPMLRLHVGGLINGLDETVLYYQQGATIGFDSDYDAYKLYGPNPGLTIAQQINNIDLQINGVEAISQVLTIPILVKAPIAGVCNIFASDFQDLPYGTSILLKDKYNGLCTNIKNNPYVFFMSDTTQLPRFELEIHYMDMPLLVEKIPANCINTIENYVVKGVGTGPWNYIWKDTLGSVLKTSTNSFLEDTFNISQAGIYRVYVETVSGDAFNYNEFNLDSIALPIAMFDIPDTVYLSGQSVFVTPLNNSSNAVMFEWDFGDSSTEIIDTTFSHVYSNAGNYFIRLAAYNEAGCGDSLTKLITVVNPLDTAQNSTNLLMETKEGFDSKIFFNGNKKFIIKNKTSENYEISVYNLNGILLQAQQYNSKELELDFMNFPSGIYTVVQLLNTKRSIFRILVL